MPDIPAIAAELLIKKMGTVPSDRAELAIRSLMTLLHDQIEQEVVQPHLSADKFKLYETIAARGDWSATETFLSANIADYDQLCDSALQQFATDFLTTPSDDEAIH